jgi:molybdopterin-guanine dinucleotide biosynthesis protein A
MVDALVLAGGTIEKERFQGLDPAIARKAQIPILGRPMVEWVVRSLRDCPQVGRIVVVGHESLDTPSLRALDAGVAPERADIDENLRAGLDALPVSPRVLALSGDVPLLTRASLDDLFTNAPEADVVFPYVERADITRDFPDREWIFARTRSGHLTGSSMALVRPDALLANWRWVEEILGARRRKPWSLALMFGLPLGVRYVLGTLGVADVEEKLSALLHLSGRGYGTRFSELAMDVDKFSDIAFVEQVLRTRQGLTDRKQ